MHVSDMIEQKKANAAKRSRNYQTTFSQSNDNFIDQIPSETPIGDPYMGIDTPSDEFYNISTHQSGSPMSARHKLQPRLLRSNPIMLNPIHSPRNQPDKNGLVLYIYQDIYTNF